MAGFADGMGRDTDNFIRTENGPRVRAGLTLRQMNTVGNRTGLEVRIYDDLCAERLRNLHYGFDQGQPFRFVQILLADHHPTAVAD